MPEYTEFLTTEKFDGFEDPVKYEKEWLPKVIAYREALARAIDPKYAIDLPKPIEQLVDDQFNSLDYLYKSNLLTSEELAITETSATELQKQLASGSLTAVAVYLAYAKRAVICHQLTNSAMELFTDEGYERAKELDKYFAETGGQVVGPMHGLPISLKEHYAYRNKVTHASMVAWVDNVTPEHCVTIQVLEDLGAVFYVRTNQPQTLMHLDSNNNFTGLTRNPFNMKLSSGGSSSGEGAIVAFGGSTMGIGSDIGGSIRSPAAFSGCFGLRPTSNRVSLAGAVATISGQESVLGVCGPLARSVEDIDFWMKHYLNNGKPWDLDGTLVRMPWRELPAPSVSGLTIGVIWDDGLVHPTPPITRGLKEVVNKLTKAGAKIIDFKPMKTKLAYETVHKMYNCDGNALNKRVLGTSGEPLTKLTKWSLNYGDGSREYSTTENRELNYIRDNLRLEYTKYMVDNKIDFLISPTYCNVAPVSECVYSWSYTSLFNILDFPTLVFQTGLFLDSEIDKWDDTFKDYQFRSELEKLELEQYDPQTFSGAPIGLQLTSRRYHDEEVVAAGKAIVELLGVSLYKK